MRDIVERYGNYTGSYLKAQRTPGSKSMYLSEISLEVPDDINKYRSFMGQLMLYEPNVVPGVVNTARKLTLHMNHPGTNS